MRAATEREQELFDKLDELIPWQFVAAAVGYGFGVGFVLAPQFTMTVVIITAISTLMSMLI